MLGTTGGKERTALREEILFGGCNSRTRDGWLWLTGSRPVSDIIADSVGVSDRLGLVDSRPLLGLRV